MSSIRVNDVCVLLKVETRIKILNKKQGIWGHQISTRSSNKNLESQTFRLSVKKFEFLLSSLKLSFDLNFGLDVQIKAKAPLAWLLFDLIIETGSNKSHDPSHNDTAAPCLPA